MKVLILNGSPRLNGDTVYILEKMKSKFPGNTEFSTLNTYQENIQPCNDCRFSHQQAEFYLEQSFFPENLQRNEGKEGHTHTDRRRRRFSESRDRHRKNSFSFSERKF